MDLIKKSIHMDRIKCKADTQITMEEDRNVPDKNPDMGQILQERGEIRIEELKASQDHVNVKGRLLLAVLYMTEEGMPSRMETEVPFEENVYLEGAWTGDNVTYMSEIEDLSLDLVNSRKISLRALLRLELCVEELYDEDVALALEQEDAVESRKETAAFAETVICKKDILRLKEEVELPQSLPNIFEILWDDIQLGSVAFEVQEGEITASGDMRIFFLYEAAGEESAVQWYEKNVSFKETIECQGCMEHMIPDISFRTDHKELAVRADQDGEDRVACLDLVLDLNIHIYEEKEEQILTDVYGIRGDAEIETRTGSCLCPLVRCGGKLRLNERGKIGAQMPKAEQVCHSMGEIHLEDMEACGEGIEFTGILRVRALYKAAGEAVFAAYEKEIPFQWTLEAPGLKEDCAYKAHPAVEQLSVTAQDGDEMEIRAAVSFAVIGFYKTERELISGVRMQEGGRDAAEALPGMAVYAARDGDDLWMLGKKYYVPLQQIREINHLEGDRLKKGDKILIVR